MSEKREFEEFIRDQASQFPYPRTPHLSASVRGRLAARTRRPGHLTLGRAGAMLVIVFAVLVVSIPEARAAVRAALQVGVVNLITGDGGGTPVEPGAAPSGLVGIELLAGETTLEGARQQAPFGIRLPAYPPDLGEPDKVFFQDSLGPMVVLVWLEGENSGRVSMSLHILGDDVSLLKLEPQVLAETEVAGSAAVWTEGPYLLVLEGAGPQQARLIEGRVLIWTRGGETYRLETDLALEGARRVAESTY